MRPAERTRRALARIQESDRPEIWISQRPAHEVLAAAGAVERRLAAGEELPLAGLTVAVKDNIDHVSAPTTAGCPAFSYRPARTAPAVARLEAAGAVVVGKTNLDQFATGLVGTRSPYGAVRDARRPRYVSGGSSSGSAVAVALGLVDLGVGTDTAGSGRVPAAFAGIFGVKPTRGLVPTDGVVPACRTLDCVTIFSRELELGERAIAVMAAPAGRPWPADAPVGASPGAAVAVPAPRELPDLEDDARAAFARSVELVRACGHPVVEVDVQPFLEAGRLLYEGAFVSERYAAAGGFIDTHPGSVDPTVASIIRAAGRIPAHALVADTERLERLRERARAEMGEAVALLLPTTTRQPLISEVAEDPVAVNARLGLYTSFANLLDMCAVALPVGHAGAEQFGAQLLGWAFADAVVADLAREIAHELVPARLPAGPPPRPSTEPPACELFVLGAHRRGQPLNRQLAERGGVYVATVATSSEYRMHRLATEPPKPGLRRSAEDGVAIEGEVWRLSPAAFADFVAALPPPMAIGPVRLQDGTLVAGFLCEASALEDAEDISVHGSWPRYLDAVGVPA